jgi:hypothetical protein
MSRFIVGGKAGARGRNMEIARSLKDKDVWFWPYYKPRQVSNYVACYNRHGLNLRTQVDVVNGVWGTTIRRKK